MNCSCVNNSMPFICGGYSQEDWFMLNGSAITIMEYADDFDDSLDREMLYIQATKPNWA